MLDTFLLLGANLGMDSHARLAGPKACRTCLVISQQLLSGTNDNQASQKGSWEVLPHQSLAVAAPPDMFFNCFCQG